MKNGGEAGQEINRFSHEHPLKLSNDPGHVCSGCMRISAGSEPIYTCSDCSYFLHKSCAQLPQQINHPCDESHMPSLFCPLQYTPKAVLHVMSGVQLGIGFSYHCAPCEMDLHPDCASLLLVLRHYFDQFHHRHNLTLTFSIVPGSPNSHTCDACNKEGHLAWFYWCVLCDFTAHLNCAMSKPNWTIKQSGFPALCNSFGGSGGLGQTTIPDLFGRGRGSGSSGTTGFGIGGF